ncbi:hypothetical protein AB0C18_40340 [Nonomuraea muscovyensis]|uniref:hypothetical protein n=1 Tax=Nonomuraea muscovyensis TaxID=1124761 RepID=UPI0033FCBA04
MVVLAGCSSAETPPRIPRSQPSWQVLSGDDWRVAADDVCPKGEGPRGLDCRSKAAGYDACVKRHGVRKLCRQALIVRVGCRFGKQGISRSERDCAASFASYLSCRTGTPRRSDEVCAAAESESARCPRTFDPAAGFDCVRARDAYYECRDDVRGDHGSCATYIEVLGLCHTLRVSCSGLLGTYLVCPGAGPSPNECAFGLTMRMNCLRDLTDGIFRHAATCDSVWTNTMRECAGSQALRADGPTPCAGGAGWNEADFSICEKQGESGETVGVAHVYPRSGGIRRPCWAHQGDEHAVDEISRHASGGDGVRVVYRHGETSYETLFR